jgi:hypothetical protein
MKPLTLGLQRLLPLVVVSILAACTAVAGSAVPNPTPANVDVTAPPTPFASAAAVPTPLADSVTPSPASTPIVTAKPRPPTTPKPVPTPVPTKAPLRYVTVKKTGQNTEIAWCPSGYHVLSGKVVLNGWNSSYPYPPDWYFQDTGKVKSGKREGWQGDQIYDNNPSTPLTITVSARCVS